MPASTVLRNYEGVALRCGDSLSLRDFLGVPLIEETPDYFSLTRVHKRNPLRGNRLRFNKIAGASVVSCCTAVVAHMRVGQALTTTATLGILKKGSPPRNQGERLTCLNRVVRVNIRGLVPIGSWAYCVAVQSVAEGRIFGKPAEHAPCRERMARVVHQALRMSIGVADHAKRTNGSMADVAERLNSRL
jgi:hypothetical protein